MKRIEPAKKPLRGELSVPGDKSIAHRAVMLASIAQGQSRILNLSAGDDNSRTVRAFRQLGVEIALDGAALCVDGKGWDGLAASGQDHRLRQFRHDHAFTLRSAGGTAVSQQVGRR